jgi:hypothetical protein
MKLRALSAAVAALAATIASLAPVFAGPVEEKVIQAPAPSSPWEFRIEPYGWATGLDGTVGAAGFTTHADVGFEEIFDHLDMALALQLEARRGRWGILADGFYAKIGDVGDTPGPLYASVSADLQQVIAQIAIAFRLCEGKWGFVDILAGGRYNYLGVDISASIDKAGVQQVSETASERVVRGIVVRSAERAAERIAQFRAAAAADRVIIENDIKAAARAEANGSIARDLAREIRILRDRLGDRLPPRVADRIERSLAGRRAALAEASAEARVAALQASVATAKAAERARAESRLAQATLRVRNEQKKLANAIDKQLNDRLPTDASTDKQWVDPIVGLRAQWNLNEHFFLAAYADIGGFGISSQLTWQAQGTLGYNFTKNIFTEVGYRYLHTDYTDGGFTYDMAQSGAFIGLGLRF